jgi:hypothetical protein
VCQVKKKIETYMRSELFTQVVLLSVITKQVAEVPRVDVADVFDFDIHLDRVCLAVMETRSLIHSNAEVSGVNANRLFL